MRTQPIRWLGTIFLALFAASCEKTEAPQQVNPAAARLAKAEAMFKERCQTAGEKIHRTVDDVDAVLLMKVRPEHRNFSDQFALNDPYGRDLGGDAYIMSFLNGFFDATTKRPEVQTKVSHPHVAYSYVEAIDTKDGKRYRYRGSIQEVERISAISIGGDGKPFKTKEFVLDKAPATGASPRWGVTYDDISTREEREYWIAGSSLKVIDLQTNEIVAERVGYMMDRGQGNTSGGRAPWLLAADNACPPFSSRHGATAQSLQTENFVEKVLKPKGGN